MCEKFLITSALPYANGPIHLGHIVEHVQSNVFIRFLRMTGADVLSVCGADSHGTPIELSALKANVSPESFSKYWQEKHAIIFKKFLIEFDGGYGGTHTKTNEKYANLFFEKLSTIGQIELKETEQAYDTENERFLPDRMIIGDCPKCGAPNQYGDSCDKCGSVYGSLELINPKSTITGNAPVLRKSAHYFFKLGEYACELRRWLNEKQVLQTEVKNFVNSWLESGLRDWCISRDYPYFGFTVPGEKSKFFYVWFDAPLAYLSLTKEATDKAKKNETDYWKDDKVNIFHFIGKDIIYFHSLFWPAMLMGANYRLPNRIHVHGMLKINGEKMSKSKGNFILAESFLRYFSPESLRYYLASKLSTKIDDIDLNFRDFVFKVNADLANKVVNIISRTFSLLDKHFQGAILKSNKADGDTLKYIEKKVASCKESYGKLKISQAIDEAIDIVDIGNKRIQEISPWCLVKDNPDLAHIETSKALWIGKVCIGLLKPIVPDMAKKLEFLLNLKEEINFANILDPIPCEVKLQKYEKLFERINEENIDKIIKDSNYEHNRLSDILNKEDNLLSIKDFNKIELRTALIIEAEDVCESDSLVFLKLNVGKLGIKNVFAGLKKSLSVKTLINKNVVFVSNLKPRKMRFGISEGMILVAGEDNLFPVFVENVLPGTRVS